MELTHEAHEELNARLNSPAEFDAINGEYGDFQPRRISRILGALIVGTGNVLYGHQPSYLKFRSIEVAARVPYFSWESAAYTLQTLFYTNAARALELSYTAKYARLAHDNETMHVVVISELARQETPSGFIRHYVCPLVFAFQYFWISYVLALIKPAISQEINYIFESHAVRQYQEFIDTHEAELRGKNMHSKFLTAYGRTPKSQYEFFQSLRNDELIHRNHSARVALGV